MEQALPGNAMYDAAPTNRTAPEAAAHTPALARHAAETRRLYTADWDDFAAWGRTRQHTVLPADPETVASYLRTLSASLSPGALARRAAAIADCHRRQNLPSPGQDESVRRVLRAAREAKRAAVKAPAAGQRLTPSRRPAPPGYAQLLRMAARCPGDLAGLRDRALLLLTAAGLGGETLLALDREHVHFTAHGMALAIPGAAMRSIVEPASVPSSAAGRAGASGPPSGHAAPAGSDLQHTAAFVTARLAEQAACPVRALERWLEHSETQFGPVFRKVNRWNGIEHARLRIDALRRIWRSRAAALRLTPAPPPSSDRAEEAV